MKFEGIYTPVVTPYHDDFSIDYDRLDVEEVVTQHGREIRIHAAARSFLHHQVRSMVGCLKLVGQGSWSEDRMASALAAKDRSELGLNAPPHGLYFVAATYPTD